MNKISKTIEESLEEFDQKYSGANAGCDGCSISSIKADEIKSHLLQSQIKVIEELLKVCEYETTDFPTIEYEAGYLDAYEKLISSLNETLEELKKSL